MFETTFGLGCGSGLSDEKSCLPLHLVALPEISGPPIQAQDCWEGRVNEQPLWELTWKERGHMTTKSTVMSPYESMMCPHLEEYILMLSPPQMSLPNLSQERKGNKDGQRYAPAPMQVTKWIK